MRSILHGSIALLGRLYFNILIGRPMKRGVKGFRKCSGSKKGGAASLIRAHPIRNNTCSKA